MDEKSGVAIKATQQEGLNKIIAYYYPSGSIGEQKPYWWLNAYNAASDSLQALPDRNYHGAVNYFGYDKELLKSWICGFGDFKNGNIMADDMSAAPGCKKTEKKTAV